MIVDLATYRRTRRIVERLPIQHTSFTIGDVRHHFPEAPDISEIRRLGEIAETCCPADTEPKGAA